MASILNPQKKLYDDFIKKWQHVQTLRNVDHTFHEAWFDSEIEDAMAFLSMGLYSQNDYGFAKNKKELYKDPRISSFIYIPANDAWSETRGVLLQKSTESMEEFKKRVDSFKDILESVKQNPKVQVKFILNLLRSDRLSSQVFNLLEPRQKSVLVPQASLQSRIVNIIQTLGYIELPVDMENYIYAEYAYAEKILDEFVKSGEAVHFRDENNPTSRTYYFVSHAAQALPEFQAEVKEYIDGENEKIYEQRMNQVVERNLEIHPEIKDASEKAEEARIAADNAFKNLTETKKRIEKELREKGQDLLRNQDALNL